MVEAFSGLETRSFDGTASAAITATKRKNFWRVHIPLELRCLASWLHRGGQDLDDAADTEIIPLGACLQLTLLLGG